MTNANPMSSVLSLLLTLMLAFGSFSGIIDSSEAPVTVDAQVTLNLALLNQLVDEDTLPEEIEGDPAGAQWMQQRKEVFSLLADVFDTVRFHVTAGDGKLALSFVSEDDEIMNLALGTDDNGVLFTSSMLPQHMLTLSREDIDALVDSLKSSAPYQMFERISELDLSLFSEDRQNLREQFQNRVLAYADEPETGEYTVEGHTFTTRRLVPMTGTELLTIVHDTVRDFLSLDSVRALLDAAGLKADPLALIDSEFEALSQLPDSEHISVEIVIYGSEGQDILTVMKLSRVIDAETGEENSLYIALGNIDGTNSLKTELLNSNAERYTLSATFDNDGHYNVEAEIADGMCMFSAVRDEDRDFSGSLSAMYNGRMMTVALDTNLTADGKAFDASIRPYGSMDALLRVTGTIGIGEAITVFDDTDLAALDIMKLVRNEDETAVTDLQIELGGSVLLTMMKLISVLPEASGQTLRNGLLQVISPALNH